MFKTALALAFVLLALLFPFAVSAQGPELPALFYGAATFYNPATGGRGPAPAGRALIAKVAGQERGRVLLPKAGAYGPCSASPCLLVQGEISAGATIEFYLEGVKADQQAQFKSGELRQLDLTFPDTAPPSAPTGVTRAGGPRSREGSFSWGASQDAESGVRTYLVDLDSSGWAEVGAVAGWATPDQLQDGFHSFAVKAVDWTGNESGAATTSFLVDLTPPSAPGNLVKASRDNDRTVRLTWSAAADTVSGIAVYLVSVDGGPPESVAEAAWTSSGQVEQGPHSVMVRARDGAGNEGAGITTSFVLDFTPPTAPSGLRQTKEAAGIRFSWGDSADVPSGLLRYDVRLDGSDWQDVGLSTDWLSATSLGEGTHTFEVRAADRAGNLSLSGSLSFSIDLTPPRAPGSLSRISPASNPRPDFSWGEATDLGSGVKEYQVQLNGGDWQSVGANLSWGVPISLAEGQHVLAVRAVDIAGNLGQAAVLSFVVDATPPQVLEVRVADTASGIVVTWRTSEPATGQVEYGDTASYGRTTPLETALATERSVALSGLAPQGTYHLRVRVKDAVGNEGLSGDQVLTRGAEARLKLASFGLAPQIVTRGDAVTLTLEVSNIGEQEAPYLLPLSINGALVRDFSGTLAPQQKITLQFSVTAGEPGDYQVAWGGLEGSFLVLPTLVAANLNVEQPLTLGSVAARGEGGRPVQAVEGTVRLSEQEGALSLSLPVTGAEGVKLESLLDAGSGLTVAGNRVTIPVRDQGGQVAFNIIAETTGLVVTGNEARGTVTAMTLEVPRRTVDLSRQDPDLGAVSVSLEAQLKRLPSGAQMQVVVKKPSAEALAQVSSLLEKDGQRIAGVAVSIQVSKQNLVDDQDVGQASVTLSVGRRWAEREGPERVRIFRLSDSGVLEALETRFQGFDGDRAVFTAVSPHGLSLFTLVSVLALPPAFRVVGLSVSSSTVASGEALTVEARLTNTGGGQGTLPVALMLDDVVKETRNVTLGVGESTTLSFTVQSEASGPHTVSVLQVQTTFRVARPAHILATGLSVTPDLARLGQPVTAVLELTNDGELTGTHQATLLVNGKVQEQQQVTLPAGQKGQVRFVVQPSAPGVYQLQAEGQEASLRVLAPAQVVVTGLRVEPSTAKAGDPVSVVVQVANRGEEAASEVVTLMLDGAEQASKRATVDPGATAEVQFALTAKGAGLHSLKAGEASASLEVLPGKSYVVQIAAGVGGVLVLAAAGLLLWRWRRRVAA
ncbi:MAG: hypothetical protein HY683_07640 [Chloroflexi bacterium]|nr:hypothetical protein [Chloroflexota bacterium]